MISQKRSRSAGRRPFSRIFLLFIMLLLFSCFDCNNKSAVDAMYKNSAYLRETAAFIAGMDLPASSTLKPLTENDQYKKYKKTLDSIWKKYRDANLKNIESWQKANIPSGISKKLFYPFSGPDILNALAFFPRSDEIIMVGLESPGDVPDPKLIDKNLIVPELHAVKTALRTLLQLNFFRTDEMKVDIRQNSFSSIPGIMMFMITRYGYELLDFKKVYIDSEGNCAPFAGDMKNVPRGIEIVFRKPGTNDLKTARFFSIDLSDGSLKKSNAALKFFGKYRKVNTFIKSASYLMHYKFFSMIRSNILTMSDLVLQEDSGMPMKFFPPKEWNLKFYGDYRVLDMFKEHYQPDFAEAMKKHSKGILPFMYGYGFSREKSNVMLATKK